MKKISMPLIAAVLMLSSCGISARYASSDDGHRFQDGLYSSSPTFISKEEKASAQQETEDLVNRTKSSQIYLFGDKKDTIAIPQNMSARIQFDQKVGGTVVTVGENPYDWRYDLENNYGYWYGPYSLGSSWYWSRHWNPYWSGWGYGPYWNSWRFYDPWYYSSFHSPWYYGGWYDPWYYGGYWGWHDPWYHHHYHCGWYDPFYHHIHHHPHGPGHITIRPENTGNRWHGLRAQTGSSGIRPSGTAASGTGRSTVRRGIGTSSNTSRTSSVSRAASSRSSSVSRASSANRQTSTRASAPAYRRPAASANPSHSESASGYDRNSSGSHTRGSGNSYDYNRSSSSTGSSYSRSSSAGNSGYSRSSSSSGSYSRGGSSSGGGSYSRSSSGNYRR